MKDVERQIRLVGTFNIKCVFVGGVAATVHGSSLPTQDIDICYSRDSENLTQIVKALRSVNATLRGAPKDIPFILDEETLAHGLNFTFDTDVGKVDLLGEVQGIGIYNDCFSDSLEVELFGVPHRILSLKKLIEAKRSAGRTKDLLVLPELEAILQYQNATDDESDSE